MLTGWWGQWDNPELEAGAASPPATFLDFLCNSHHNCIHWFLQLSPCPGPCLFPRPFPHSLPPPSSCQSPDELWNLHPTPRAAFWTTLSIAAPAVHLRLHSLASEEASSFSCCIWGTFSHLRPRPCPAHSSHCGCKSQILKFDHNIKAVDFRVNKGHCVFVIIL